MSDSAATFEPHRARLLAVAYRMLGSYAEAEDAVQDTFLRWHQSDREDVADARAFLTTVVSRIALDRLGSARARRESYVGAWLPEPVLDQQVPSPEVLTEYAEDLSMALLVTLERLSPLERAAFLLHDVFDLGFDDVAETLGRSADAIRQLAARARAHVHGHAPRFAAAPAASRRLAERFEAAVLTGDLAGLATHLAEDVVLYSDAGGKKRAALNPIYGRDKVMRFFAGVAPKHAPVNAETLCAVTLNGMPGFLLRDHDGSIETAVLDVRDGSIVSIYLVRNPDKLGHITWPAR